MSEVVVREDTTPALLDQAERALALVTQPNEAEDLFRKLSAIDQAARLARMHSETQLRVGKLRLRAERRWGELLGEPENLGVPVTAGNRLADRDKIARHRARDVAGVTGTIFERYIAAVRDPEMLRRARLLRLQREWEAEQRRAEPIEATFKVGDIEIRHGDLRSVLNDLSDVDAIITDPPYPAEFLGEFDALGQVAERILSPAGLLVTMVGQTHLPEYLERLGRCRPYRWCGAYLMDGPAVRIHGRKVGSKWKPLLIFGGDEFITQDVFMSRGDDKEHHHWGQSESGMADIVDRLTNPGDLVVDPFLGGGTTALVCKELGRRFVGCDIDADAVTTTRERLAA